MLPPGRGIGGLQTAPTFREWFIAKLLRKYLWVICVFIGLLLIGWWAGRPDLSEVKEILGKEADPKVVLDTYKELQKDHFDRFRDLLQMVLLSALIPIFNLLAGYAFGSRDRSQTTEDEEEEA